MVCGVLQGELNLSACLACWSFILHKLPPPPFSLSVLTEGPHRGIGLLNSLSPSFSVLTEGSHGGIGLLVSLSLSRSLSLSVLTEGPQRGTGLLESLGLCLSSFSVLTEGSHEGIALLEFCQVKNGASARLLLRHVLSQWGVEMFFALTSSN